MEEDEVGDARERASALLSRAVEFCYGAKTLIESHKQGALTSSLLLLGFTAELIAKKRLLERGVPEKVLKNSPYGHNVFRMWSEDSALWEEAEQLFLKTGGKDDFTIHLCVLDYLCGGSSEFSIRYNKMPTYYPESKYLVPVFLEILRRERMRHETWES